MPVSANTISRCSVCEGRGSVTQCVGDGGGSWQEMCGRCFGCCYCTPEVTEYHNLMESKAAARGPLFSWISGILRRAFDDDARHKRKLAVFINLFRDAVWLIRSSGLAADEDLVSSVRQIAGHLVGNRLYSKSPVLRGGPPYGGPRPYNGRSQYPAELRSAVDVWIVSRRKR
jgi:hypothetical protein